MAKKLVSLLCAVAMLVTMVSVAAFTASAETETINFLSSENTGKWIKSYPESLVGTRGVLYSGAFDFTTVEGWDRTYIQGALLTRQCAGTNVHEVNFTYNEKVSLGDAFSLKTTMFINADISNANAATSDTINAIVLGSYEFRFVRLMEDCTAGAGTSHPRTLFRVVLYKNGTELGRSNFLDDNVLTKFGGQKATAAYPNLINKTSAAMVAANGACTAANGKTSSQGTIYKMDESYRDFTLVVQNNQLSVLDGNGNAIGFVDSETSETVMSYSVASGDFDNMRPVVRFYSDTKHYQYAPSCAIFRLSATYEAGKYVYLDANGGSCDASTVSLTESGTPALPLPDPTRNRYQFDGWFTAAEGGEKVTLDTALSHGETIYAHWTELPIFGNFTADNTEAKAFGANPETGKPYTSVDFPAYTTFFNSANFGNALVVETWRSTDGVAAVSTLGNFTMSKFSTEFSLYFRNEPVADKNHVELQFGGLVVTISKSSRKGFDYNVSASYNGSDLTLSNTATVYENIEAELKDDGKEGDLPRTRLRDEMVAAIGSTSEISLNDISRFPAGKISFRVSYENGTLTIETVNSKAATFTATAAVPEASFSNAKVKVTLFSKSTSLILGNWKSSFSNDDEILTPSGKQPVQDEHLALNFIYTPDDLAGYEGKELSASVTVGGEAYETVLETKTYQDPEGKDIECRVVKVKCLRPDKFEDTIAITLTAGETTGSTYTYSIKQYCFNVFADSKKSEIEKQLVVDLLYYGVTSKLYVDNAYDYSKVQAEATAAGMQVTDRDFSECEKVVSGEGSGPLSLKQVGLWLTDDIGLWFSFDKNQAGASDASLVCSVDGTTKVASSSSFTEDGDDYIAVIPVGAVQAFKNVVFYLSTDGTTPASKEYTYSLAGSAYKLSQTAVDPNNMNESELALAYAKQNLGNAILRYCDSCVKYNEK